MESPRSLCFFSWALFACLLVSSSVALASNTFYVGGKDGWVTNPSESYNNWTERNRFQVNDTLVFKYKNGSDSVLLVNKDDYSSCNTKKPLKTLSSGSSVFQLDKSGPFYFISGNQDNCRKGQKLIVVVLADRPPPVSQPPPAKAPSPVSHTPPKPPSPGVILPPTSSPSPKSPSPAAYPPFASPTPAKSPYPSTNPPAPAHSPKPPSPTAYPPAISPTPSPSANPPAPAHSPKSPSPAVSPTPEKSPSPSANPPTPASPSPSASQTPAKSPSPSATNQPPSATTPGSSSGPASSPEGNESDLAPAPAASWVATPSTVIVMGASLLISSVIGVWP